MAQAYALAAANRSAEGLALLGFLPISGNESSMSELDVLIMRGVLKLYVDDLPTLSWPSPWRKTPTVRLTSRERTPGPPRSSPAAASGRPRWLTSTRPEPRLSGFQ